MSHPRIVVAVALTLTLVLDASAAAERTVRPGLPPHPAGAPATRADSVIDFRLGDQFGRAHDAADYRGRALLLVGAGRGGRAAGTAWVATLRGLQSDTTGAAAIPVVAVADLRGVPRLLRRVVRGRFPKDRRQAVLLDWDGSLARRLGLDAERCTIVLVGPDGRPAARMSPTTVNTVAARELLRQAAGLTSASRAESP
jgi:hypothetical protein